MNYEAPDFYDNRSEDANVSDTEIIAKPSEGITLEIHLNEAGLILFAKSYYESGGKEILLGGRQTFKFIEDWSVKTLRGFSGHFRVETSLGLKTYKEVSEPLLLQGVEFDGVNDCLILVN